MKTSIIMSLVVVATLFAPVAADAREGASNAREGASNAHGRQAAYRTHHHCINGSKWKMRSGDHGHTWKPCGW